MANTLVNLNASIDYLKLYVRANNFLKRNNINTIWQLVSLSEEELENLPDAEWMFIENIKSCLEKNDLHLDMVVMTDKNTGDLSVVSKLESKIFDDEIIKYQEYNEKLKEINENKQRKILILDSILQERLKLEKERELLDKRIAEYEGALDKKTLVL